jgi:hypothetical protein
MSLKNAIKSLLVCGLLLSFSGVNAQFNLKEFENIQKLKKVPLLVVMETPNQKKVKRLEKKNPEELKAYLDGIDGKNNAVIASIKKDWKISKDIRFIDKTVLKRFKTPENKGKYAYFTAEVYDKVKWKQSKTGYLAYTNYSVHIIGDVTPVSTKRYSYELDSENVLANKDIQLALNEIQGQFKAKEMRVAKRTAKKTLKRETRLAKNTFSDDE